MTFRLKIIVALLIAAAAGLLFTYEYPPVIGVQRGYRGVGMQEVYNPRSLRATLVANQVPPSLPQAAAAGPRAGSIYSNVKVLGDLSVGQFTRLMAAMTNWVAPAQGCAYCHSLKNMADDSLYTKVVARRMLQMVRHVNADWKSHVANVGVTCYTCHRGQPVPTYIWHINPGPPHANGFAETRTGAGSPATAADLSSLPYDAFTPFLLEDKQIRVQSLADLPSGDLQSIKQTEWTYSLMLHFAQSLGVNCTYCHNTRAFGDWSQSPPSRVTAWYGIRMVRDLNNDYLQPLAGVFPAARLGPLGDAPKLNCMTCHQGAYKPLFGASMISAYPELAGTGAEKP